MVDKGERYEISLEVPGIPKEKIDIKATKNHLEVSGQQEKKTEEKGRNYVYNERAYIRAYTNAVVCKSFRQAYTYSRGSYSFKNRCKNGTWYSLHNTS